MFNILHTCRILGWSVIFNMLCVLNAAGIQPTVIIDADPAIEVLSIASPPKEIILTARTTAPDLQFAWKLEGLGKLGGDITSPSIRYIPPETLHETSAAAVISVTATDKEGQTGSASITFTLTAPTPSTPIPMPPTPMPTPTLMPTPPIPTPTPKPKLPTPTPAIPTPTPKPKLPTPTPTAAPIISPKIRQIMLKDAKGLFIHPGKDERYHVKPGENISFMVEVENPSNLQYSVEYDPKRGEIRSQTYIAPKTAGDTDTILIKLLTNALADTTLVEIKVIDNIYR